MDRFWNEAKNTHYKKFVMLVNYKGMGMRCVDLNLIMSFLPVLQNCYPEVCQVNRIAMNNSILTTSFSTKEDHSCGCSVFSLWFMEGYQTFARRGNTKQDFLC